MIFYFTFKYTHNKCQYTKILQLFKKHLTTFNSNVNVNNIFLRKVLQDTKQEQQWITLPYAGTIKSRKQGELFKNYTQNPQDTSVILFPGQGSQYVGMANNLLKYRIARDLFELSSYILGYDLLKLCMEGPKEKLDQTQYCQPAIMVCSLAAVEKLKETHSNVISNCIATAGFSLGEITSLVFAGALDFERALYLVKVRAEAMQVASEMYEGGMAIIIYGPESKLNYACLKAKQWAKDKGDIFPECKIANYLYPHCKVISGSKSAMDFLQKNFKNFYIRKYKQLYVNGAFHCDLMSSAVEPFKRALEKSVVSKPLVNVYSCVDGKCYKTADHVRNQLPSQITKPVKWEQLLHVIYERDPNVGFPTTIECGPGRFLKSVLKQVNSKAWIKCYTSED